MNDLERSRPPESPLDNFGVDFNCDTNTLFARLTEKPSKTVCLLSSNWNDISDVKDYGSFTFGNTYDIFGSIEMYLSSSLKIMSVPGIRDRNSRIIKAEATLINDDHTPWESKVAKVIPESSKLGIDLSFIDPVQEFFDQTSWLVPQNPELKWAIRFQTIAPKGSKDGNRCNRVHIVCPFQGVLDLEGRQTVQSILQNMSSAIEHTLRVCYAIEGKSLPEKRLIFFPHVEPGEAKEVPAFVTCSYCKSSYPGSGIKCPSCGAPTPRPF